MSALKSLPAGESPGGPRSRRMRATRERIVSAALDLAGDEPAGRLTAERIAARAGVSRRTFFNYFPTVEAAFFAPVQNLLQAAVEQLDRIPRHTPLVESMLRAMTAAAAAEPLERLGRCAHLGARLPQLQGSDLEQWDAADALLSAAFERRYPHVDPFVTTCLTGAVVGTCRAAVREWECRTAGHPDEHSEALLRDLLGDALALVGTGFAAVVDTS